MQRKKTGIIWQITKELLSEYARESESLADIVRKLNLCISGTTYTALKKRLEVDGIKYKKGLDSKNNEKRKLEDVLTNNSNYGNNSLKKRLIKEGILKNECSICKIGPIWMNKSLSLQLDHINGRRTDNRLKNLRILCPNCHTQTPTYAGKKHKKHRICTECGLTRSKHSKSGLCGKCSSIKKSNNKKFNVSKIELEQLIVKYPVTTVGRMFNVSDNAIRKRCVALGIEIQKRGQGFWSKKEKNN